MILAAAAIAGADQFLAVGGAHGIASLAYGFDGFSACDVVVGPGNRWVTAAKQLVVGVVGIDMLAGPSELLVIADESADAEVVAADLLAQAEHDTDAVPMLVTTSGGLADEVEAALARRLTNLRTRETASAALGNGFVCVVGSVDEVCACADQIAPEHLEIMMNDALAVADRVRNAGGCSSGRRAPRCSAIMGRARTTRCRRGGRRGSRRGCRCRTSFVCGRGCGSKIRARRRGLIDDAIALAGVEGLDGHASSALARTADGGLECPGRAWGRDARGGYVAGRRGTH